MDKAWLSGLVVRKLEKSDRRAEFDCGVAELNSFLQKHARQNQKKGVSVTYVALDGEKLAGYYTLSTSTVLLDALPESEKKKLPKYPVSFARIGRLARELSFRGRGLGPFLLVDASRRVLALSSEIGIYGIEVDAKNEEAKEFYKGFGFRELLDNPLHLYISLKTLNKAFSS